MRICEGSMKALAVMLTTATLAMAGCNRGASSVPVTPGWTRHTTTAGLVLDAPAGWRVNAGPQGTARPAAPLIVAGPGGEQVIFWPLSLRRPDLSTGDSQALALHVARTLHPGQAWSVVPAAGPGAVRAVSRGGSLEGVTLLLWQPAPAGIRIVVYSLLAPRGRYAAAAPTFEKILASIRAAQPEKASAAGPAAVAPAAPRFVTWTDPREGAFSTLVPDGWKVVGGAYRMSATDVRSAITALSADGAVRVTVGDANVGAFTMPTRMHAFAGLREGNTTSLGDGSVLQISRFVPGQAFARQYVERFLGPVCGGGLQVTAANDRPDLAGEFTAQARGEGLPNAQLSAGDVAFTCAANGRAVTGRYVAATMIPLPGAGPLWYVYRLYGFLAPAERQQEAEQVCRQALQAWQVNAAWREQERRIAAAAVQQDNLRSQQVRARALAAIAEDLRQTSEIVSSSYWQRQRVYDEISRKRENAILGTVDVVDPATGQQHKIEYNADYHWMDAQGAIAGTLTDTAPGPGWRQLIDLK